MKLIIFLILLFPALPSFCQTKVIAHKSHSGSKKTFSSVYKGNLHNSRYSNYGLPGNRNIFLLDTVFAISDKEILLKYRESNICYGYFTDYTTLKPSDFEKKSIRIKDNEVLNSKSTIQQVIDYGVASGTSLWFNNPIDKVIFIGFKKETK